MNSLDICSMIKIYDKIMYDDNMMYQPISLPNSMHTTNIYNNHACSIRVVIILSCMYVYMFVYVHAYTYVCSSIPVNLLSPRARTLSVLYILRIVFITANVAPRVITPQIRYTHSTTLQASRGRVAPFTVNPIRARPYL